MVDVNSLYPQPPQQQQSLGGMNALDLINRVNQLKMFQARQAGGQALQGAIGPDGSINTSGALSALAGNPNAALVAPEMASSFLGLQTQQLQNKTAQFGLSSGYNDVAQRIIGSLAMKPGQLGDDDIAGAAADMARSGIPPDQATSFALAVPRDPAGRKTFVTNFLNRSNPAAAFTRTPAVDANGQPISIPQGTANYGSGAVPTGMPPPAVAGQEAYIKQQSAETTNQSALRNATLAYPLVEQLDHQNFGPGSRQLNEILTTGQMAGLLPKDTPNDPTAIRQVLGKLMQRYVGLQRNAERSDESLHQTQESNPNFEMTHGAYSEALKNQIGMDRVDAMMTRAYDSANPGEKFQGGKFNDFKRSYYGTVDQRAVQWDLYNPQERSDIVKSLGAPSTPSTPNPAWDKFQSSYNLARSTGQIAPTPQAAPAASQ